MASLTVHVLDAKQRPLSGKRVFCEYPGFFLGIIGSSQEGCTDSSGSARFTDVPSGRVRIHVDGKPRLEVLIASYERKDVTITIT